MPDHVHGAPSHGETDPPGIGPDRMRDREANVLSTLPPADPRLLQRLRDAAEAVDAARLTELVRNNWFDLILHSNRALRDVMRSVPAETLRDSPLLAMLAGIVFYSVPSRRLIGLRLFVGATRAAASDKSDVRSLDRALVLTSASASYRLIGHPALGVKPARTALRVLGDLPDTEREKIHVLPRLYAHIGATLYAGGETDEALSAFEHGLAEVPEEGYPHGFMNLAMLAGIHALQGDLRESLTYLGMARSPEWPEATVSMYPGTYYRIAEATVALEHSDVPTARHHLEAMVHDRATIEHWIPIALTEALTELVDRHPGAALAGLDAFAAARQGEGRSASTRKRFAPMRSLLHLALRNPEAAIAALSRDAVSGVEKDVARARIDLVLRNEGAALHRLRRLTGSRLTTRLGAEAAVLEAVCLLRLPDRSLARSTVESLGARLRSSGLRLPLLLVPDEDLVRLRSALRDEGYHNVLVGLPPAALLPDFEGERLLSEREQAVLEALVSSSTNAEIAEVLFVSVNTVKTQLKSIYRKLGVTTRDEAIAVALARHLVTVNARASDDEEPG